MDQPVLCVPRDSSLFTMAFATLSARGDDPALAPQAELLSLLRPLMDLPTLERHCGTFPLCASMENWEECSHIQVPPPHQCLSEGTREIFRGNPASGMMLAESFQLIHGFGPWYRLQT